MLIDLLARDNNLFHNGVIRPDKKSCNAQCRAGSILSSKIAFSNAELALLILYPPNV